LPNENAPLDASHYAIQKNIIRMIGIIEGVTGRGRGTGIIK